MKTKKDTTKKIKAYIKIERDVDLNRRASLIRTGRYIFKND